MRRVAHVWDFAEAYVEARHRGDTERADQCLAAIDYLLTDRFYAGPMPRTLPEAEAQLASLTEQRDAEQEIVSRLRSTETRVRLHTAIARYGNVLRSAYTEAEEFAAYQETVAARRAYVAAWRTRKP